MYYYPIYALPWQGRQHCRPPVWNPWQGQYYPYSIPFAPNPTPFVPTGMQVSPGTRSSGNVVSGGKPSCVPKNDLRPEQFTAKNLSRETLDKIVSKYGVEIEDIYRLAPGQKWMFGRSKKVTNAFFLQTYFKVTMELKPADFRQKLDEVSLKRDNLRTAFVYRGLDEPYQVVLKNRRPELNFIDRSDKTMEELGDELETFLVADRRRGFDLENDPLLRITVFSTAEENVYAIVSSQPHINDDGASEMIMFKEIFLDYAVGDKVQLPEFEIGSYQNYAKWLEGLDRETEYKYWEQLLSGASETRLPGKIPSSLEPEMNTLSLSFSPKENDIISKLQMRYGTTLNSVVQAAWAVMLQKIYHTTDVVFGTITSGRSAEVQGSDRITGGFVNAFPVRVQARADETVLELAKRIQTQIVESQGKAHFSPDELGEKLGRKTEVFDHLLNFHNFSGASKDALPVLPGFTLLGADFYDNLSTGFCLYFQEKENGFQCLFTYDCHSFTKRKIRLLMDCYQKVFRQILSDEGKTLLVEQIECPDISAFLSAEKDELEELEHIQSFLRGLPLFEGISDTAVKTLAKSATVKNYVAGDEILRENSVPKGVDIVMGGFVEAFCTLKTGWMGTMQILHSGSLISAAGVLDNVKSFHGADVYSDEASVLHFPKETYRLFLEKYPQAALNMIKEQEKLARRLTLFWTNA